jgi:hypothetical protein
MGKGIISPIGRHAQGNVWINVNVSYNLSNKSENNKLGKTFEGITITGSLSQKTFTSDVSMDAIGTLSVVYGEKIYSEVLKIPKNEYIRETGTIVRAANIFIPAKEIGTSNALSNASIKAGNTNNKVISLPIQMNWDLQEKPIFRSLKQK